MSTLLPLLARERLTASELEQIYTHFHSRADFISDLIAALDQLDANLTYRATALLTKIARAAPLSNDDLARIFDRLDTSEHWLHRLTACQFLSARPIPPELGEDVFPFLERCFADRRVIIRAWALTAMTSFRTHPRLRRSVLDALRAARRDPAKSMQARLRQLEASRA